MLTSWLNNYDNSSLIVRNIRIDITKYKSTCLKFLHHLQL